MKKSFLLSLLFVATFTYCKAQPKPYKIVKQFYDTSNTWVDSVEFLLWYDSSDLLVKQTRTDIFSSTNKPIELDSFEYTTFGARKKFARHFWDTVTKKWEATPKVTYNYYYKNNLLRQIEMVGPFSTHYDSFEYNTNNELEFFYIYSSNSYRDKAIYNSNGDIDTLFQQLKDGGNWKNINKEEYLYNSSNQVKSIEYFHNNTGTSAWIPQDTAIFTYSAGVLQKARYGPFNHHRILRGIVGKYEVYTYNTDGSLNTITAQGSTWTPRRGNAKLLFFYKSSTGLKDFKENNIKIYPNPTSGKFTVELEGNTLSTINITDITGKQVFTSKASDSLDIDLSHLQKGVYIVNVQANNGVKTQKVIVQ